MILAVASTLHMVMIVGVICLTVATNTDRKSSQDACWIRPPTMADRKIHTPGVLIQTKLMVLGSAPV